MPVFVGPNGERTSEPTVEPGGGSGPVERIRLGAVTVENFAPCPGCAHFEGCPIRRSLTPLDVRMRELPPELTVTLSAMVDCRAFAPAARSVGGGLRRIPTSASGWLSKAA